MAPFKTPPFAVVSYGCESLGPLRLPPPDSSGDGMTMPLTNDQVACGNSFEEPLTFHANQRIPEGLGFLIGSGTPVRFAVFCLHFHDHSSHGMHPHAHVSAAAHDVTGKSSLRLKVMDAASAAAAGVKAAAAVTMRAAKGRRIAGKSVTSVLAMRQTRGKGRFSPVFAVGHSHGLAVRHRLWVTRREDGSNVTLLDARVASPPDPSLLPVLHPGSSFSAGDLLVAECTFNNTSPLDLVIG